MQGDKQKSGGDNFDIVGVSEDKSEVGGLNFRRLVMKSNYQESKNIALKVKKSLLRHCLNFEIRTDMAETGMYLFRFWILKLILGLQQDHKLEFDSISVRSSP